MVLTVAHNLYNYKSGEFYYDFKFYPGQCGPLEKYYEVEDFFIPGKFILNPCTTNDYVLIKLKQKIEISEFIPLSGGLKEVDELAKLTLCGYPKHSNYKPTSLELKNFNVYQFGATKVGKVV